MMIAVRAVFREENKYCSQVFLDECLYKSQMLKYDAIEVSGGIKLTKPMVCMGVLFVITGTSLT